jgi:hypothetical protein
MVAGILAALLVPAAIALAVWKLYTRYLDKQEYMKFEEIQKTAQSVATL